MDTSGVDLVSGATQKTSRNLKIIASTVFAIKLFDVPIDDLRMFNVDLPAPMFDWVAAVILIYLMTVLGWYWRIDYIMWKNGPILTSHRAQEYFKRASKVLSAYGDPSDEQISKWASDYHSTQRKVYENYGALKVEILALRRSFQNIKRSTCWFLLIVFLIIPELLGLIALISVAEGIFPGRVVSELLGLAAIPDAARPRGLIPGVG